MQSSTLLLLTVASALWALYGTLLGCLGAAAKWSFTGRLEPHAGFPMYDSLSFRRALVLISEIPLGEPLLEALRARQSILHTFSCSSVVQTPAADAQTVRDEWVCHDSTGVSGLRV